MVTAQIIERLRRELPVGDSLQCWEWPGPRLPSGYGIVAAGGQQAYAHRAAVIADGQVIPPGHVVMHLCDNPPCANPAHLKVGTQADNRRDCASKGRNPRNGNEIKTHCIRGHEFAIHARRTGRGNQRVCRACEAARLRRRRHSDEASWVPIPA